MDKLLSVTWALHVPVFAFSLLYRVLVLDFLHVNKEWSGSTLEYKVVTLAILSYPIVFVLGYFLSKKASPSFAWLPTVNLLVLLVALLIFFGQLIFALTPWSEGSRAVKRIEEKNRTENLSALAVAPRDFVCSDGTFFSIEKGKVLDNVLYYDKFTLEHPESLEPPLIGSIKEGKSKIKINLREDAKLEVEEKLMSCKNTNGKTFYEVYPKG